VWGLWTRFSCLVIGLDLMNINLTFWIPWKDGGFFTSWTTVRFYSSYFVCSMYRRHPVYDVTCESCTAVDKNTCLPKVNACIPLTVRSVSSFCVETCPLMELHIKRGHGNVALTVRNSLISFLACRKHHAMKAYCGSGGIAPRILRPRH
jgi:hypothetical protein